MRSLKIVPTKPALEDLPDSLRGEAPHLERALVPLSIVLVLVITSVCQQVPRWLQIVWKAINLVTLTGARIL